MSWRPPVGSLLEKPMLGGPVPSIWSSPPAVAERPIWGRLMFSNEDGRGSDLSCAGDTINRESCR